MLSLFQILMLILDIVWFFIIAHVIMSWLINFQVLNLNQQFVAHLVWPEPPVRAAIRPGPSYSAKYAGA